MLTVNASDDMLAFTAMIGLVIGVVFVFVGRKGRQLWMWTWGSGLTFCSIYLWMSIRFDFRLFGVF